MKDQYEIQYTKGDQCVALNDTAEKTIIILEIVQVEALLEWYCKEFDRILM